MRPRTPGFCASSGPPGPPLIRRVRPLLAALTIAAATLLAGCGFHLEGRAPLPAAMRHPYIQTQDEQSDFVQSLRRALLISGARPAAHAGHASAVIRILQDHVASRVLSVSATNRPTEYEVRYSVRFSVSAAGKQLLPPQTLSALRSYTFNESLLLADQHEKAILEGAMGRELADNVMRRLASLRAMTRPGGRR